MGGVGGGVGWVSVSYLVSKLPQPVRLQRQSQRTEDGDKTKREKCGRGYGSNKEGQKGKLSKMEKKNYMTEFRLC